MVDPAAAAIDGLVAAVLGCAERADHLVDAARACAASIQAGGSLLVDAAPERRAHAEHVAVEFVHPVITGKRAVAALVGDGRVLRAAPDDVRLWLGPGPVPASEAVHGSTVDLAAIAGDGAHVADVTMVLTHHLLWELTHAVLDHHRPDDYLRTLADDRGQGIDASDVVAKVELSASTIRRTLERHATLLADVAAHVSGAGRVWTFGQGGSAADAALVAARLGGDCLSSNPAVLTALVNDIGPDAMYVRQVATHVRSEDLVIALTTSGTSPAVLRGLSTATALGARTLACTGAAGLADDDPSGATATATDVVAVGSDSIHRIQEAHLAAASVIARLARRT